MKKIVWATAVMVVAGLSSLAVIGARKMSLNVRILEARHAMAKEMHKQGEYTVQVVSWLVNQYLTEYERGKFSERRDQLTADADGASNDEAARVIRDLILEIPEDDRWTRDTVQELFEAYLQVKQESSRSWEIKDGGDLAVWKRSFQDKKHHLGVLLDREKRKYAKQ